MNFAHLWLAGLLLSASSVWTQEMQSTTTSVCSTVYVTVTTVDCTESVIRTAQESGPCLSTPFPTSSLQIASEPPTTIHSTTQRTVTVYSTLAADSLFQPETITVTTPRTSYTTLTVHPLESGSSVYTGSAQSTMMGRRSDSCEVTITSVVHATTTVYMSEAGGLPNCSMTLPKSPTSAASAISVPKISSSESTLEGESLSLTRSQSSTTYASSEQPAPSHSAYSLFSKTSTGSKVTESSIATHPSSIAIFTNTQTSIDLPQSFSTLLLSAASLSQSHLSELSSSTVSQQFFPDTTTSPTSTSGSPITTTSSQLLVPTVVLTSGASKQAGVNKWLCLLCLASILLIAASSSVPSYNTTVRAPAESSQMPYDSMLMSKPREAVGVAAKSSIQNETAANPHARRMILDTSYINLPSIIATTVKRGSLTKNSLDVSSRQISFSSSTFSDLALAKRDLRTPTLQSSAPSYTVEGHKVRPSHKSASTPEPTSRPEKPSKRCVDFRTSTYSSDPATLQLTPTGTLSCPQSRIQSSSSAIMDTSISVLAASTTTTTHLFSSCLFQTSRLDSETGTSSSLPTSSAQSGSIEGLRVPVLVVVISSVCSMLVLAGALLGDSLTQTSLPGSPSNLGTTAIRCVKSSSPGPFLMPQLILFFCLIVSVSAASNAQWEPSGIVNSQPNEFDHYSGKGMVDIPLKNMAPSSRSIGIPRSQYQEPMQEPHYEPPHYDSIYNRDVNTPSFYAKRRVMRHKIIKWSCIVFAIVVVIAAIIVAILATMRKKAQATAVAVVIPIPTSSSGVPVITTYVLTNTNILPTITETVHDSSSITSSSLQDSTVTVTQVSTQSLSSSSSSALNPTIVVTLNHTRTTTEGSSTKNQETTKSSEASDHSFTVFITETVTPTLNPESGFTINPLPTATTLPRPQLIYIPLYSNSIPASGDVQEPSSVAASSSAAIEAPVQTPEPTSTSVAISVVVSIPESTSQAPTLVVVPDPTPTTSTATPSVSTCQPIFLDHTFNCRVVDESEDSKCWSSTSSLLTKSREKDEIPQRSTVSDQTSSASRNVCPAFLSRTFSSHRSILCNLLQVAAILLSSYLLMCIIFSMDYL